MQQETPRRVEEVATIAPEAFHFGRTRDQFFTLSLGNFVVCLSQDAIPARAALGTPVVALFGRTVASILIRDVMPCTVLTDERPCQGCRNAWQAVIESGACLLQIASCMDPIGVDTLLTQVWRELKREG